MLLSDRRNFLFALGALSLAGCGFTPVYQRGTAASVLAGNVLVDLIDSREGFELLERLESHLGTAGPSAPYGLAIELEFEEEGLAISTSNVTTRFTVFGTAEIQVRDTSSGDSLYSAKIELSTGYNATTSTASTIAAQRSAYQRLALDLADKINTRLAITAKDWAL